MKAIKGRVLIKMDTRQKERYDLGNGATLYIEKGYDFNRRVDKPSMAEIIDGEGLPNGAEILVHHNASEQTYEVSGVLTQEETIAGYMVFCIPKDMCFCYRQKGKWKPCENFVISQRIFKPYKGKLVAIQPKQIKNRLYIVKGGIEWDGEKQDLSGKVCVVTENSDYEIIFHTKYNKPESVIRTRHREILAIDNKLGRDIKGGKYLIGENQKNSKKMKK